MTLMTKISCTTTTWMITTLMIMMTSTTMMKMRTITTRKSTRTMKSLTMAMIMVKALVSTITTTSMVLRTQLDQSPSLATRSIMTRIITTWTLAETNNTLTRTPPKMGTAVAIQRVNMTNMNHPAMTGIIGNRQGAMIGSNMVMINHHTSRPRNIAAVPRATRTICRWTAQFSRRIC